MRQALVKEDTRELILDACDRLLARYGYKKMTMEDLAREAGIGKGTIYLYFRSKEEVALSSADRSTKGVQDRLRGIADEPLPPAERIHRMLVMRVLMRFDLVQPYTRSLDDLFMSLRPAFLTRREKWLQAEADIFAEVLVEGTLLNAFDVPDPTTASRAMLLATNALMPFSLSPAELGLRNEVERKASSIADLLLRGILRSNSKSQ
jgi:AcrR family transcriptional regulator